VSCQDGTELLTGRTIRLRRVAPEMVKVTNESHEKPAEHQNTASIDDVAYELMACTCPHHVHCTPCCTHVAAVETATVDGTLTAFQSDNGETDEHETAEYDCNGFIVASRASHAGRHQGTAELTIASTRTSIQSEIDQF
jgi:hypothetical protein